MLKDSLARHPDQQHRDLETDSQGMPSRNFLSSTAPAPADSTNYGDRDSHRYLSTTSWSSQHRQMSTDRNGDHPNRSSREQRRGRDHGSKSRHLTAELGRGESHSRAASPLAKSRTSSSSKRPRSSFPSAAGSEPKKSRRGCSPRRLNRSHPENPITSPSSERCNSPTAPRRRDRSRERRDRRNKAKKKPYPPRSLSPQHRPRQSRSRSRDETAPNPNQIPIKSKAHIRRRSPSPNSRLSPRSRLRSPLVTGQTRPLVSSTDIQSLERPNHGLEYSSYHSSNPPPPPHRSPREARPREPSRNDRNWEETHHSQKAVPSSGANSIEVNVSARAAHRSHATSSNGFPSQSQTSLSLQPQNQDHNHNQPVWDGRSYHQSSGHGSPRSSYLGSPPAQSPYSSSGGRGWGGAPQYPTRNQISSQISQRNFCPPNGSSEHYQATSPSYSPSRPSVQHSYVAHRGGSRGSLGRFRGNSHFGGHRGGRKAAFKSGHWNPSDSLTANGDPDAYRTADGADGPPLTNPRAAPEHVDDQSERGDSHTDDTIGPSASLTHGYDAQAHDLAPVHDAMQVERDLAESMPPPSRPSHVGSQSSKFSFAFKTASKPNVTAPKPEISSKLNAAPRRTENRSQRDLPRDVPTEPSSARSRARCGSWYDKESHASELAPLPRITTVRRKTIKKRLKPRPTLAPEFAASDSVFFRKPGNESVVGSGTYGKVFKGRNVYTNNLVALKKIRMEGERDGFPVTAVREIKLLQSLRHMNIVELQEVMVEKNDCFMVFEYLSHDLTGLLHHPTLKLEAAHKKHLAKQLFDGLHFLHSRGVLHRDIKAANILVSSDGVLKLADFGLARFFAKRRQLDYTNRVITIWYRSPELLLGETQYGPGVDIWSAACVMVEIFTRHPLFPGDGTELNQLDKIYRTLGTPSKQDWPDVTEMPWFELLRPSFRLPSTFSRTYQGQVSPAAFDLLSWMLRYDPAKRPSTAQVLKHAYFVTEEPAPRQAVELAELGGDWHEFESKALRRENERKQKEARRTAKETSTVSGPSTREKDNLCRKRPGETEETRENKRLQLDGSVDAHNAPGAHSLSGASTTVAHRES